MGEIRINFFEEFYTISSLIARCKNIPFSSTVYIASKSLNEFLFIQARVKKAAPHIEVGYWPILSKSYWISPFSYNAELLQLYDSLSSYKDKEKIKVLLDFELPLLHLKLFFINLFSFKKNKKVIKKILALGERTNIQFFSAEYNLPLAFFQFMVELLGIHYSHKQFNYTTIFMYYNISTTRIFNISLTINELKKHSYNEIALGIIAPGVFDETNLLSPAVLKKNLEKLKKEKITGVTIFSLAGFTGEYRKVICQTMVNKDNDEYKFIHVAQL